MGKIGFCTDTNIIKGSPENFNNSKNIFNGIDFFVDYINDYSKLKKNSKIELNYFMPKYILDELINQKNKAFMDDYKKLENIYNKIEYGIKGTIPKLNITNYLNDLRKKYEEKTIIIKLEYNKKVFNKLVSDAFEKKPPFDKSIVGKKSDSGFKDAVIWNTVVNSKEIECCDHFYFFSGDKVFNENKETLENEFKKQHKKTEINIVYIGPEGNQWQKSLQTILDNHNLPETNIVKLYNEELVLNEIKKLKYKSNGFIYYIENEFKYHLDTISFNKFVEEDFNIEKVINTDSNNYEVKIFFKTGKYNLIEEKLDNNKTLYGYIFLTFSQKEKNLELIDYRISDVMFSFDSFTITLNGLTNAVNKMFEENGIKEALFNLSETINNNFKIPNGIAESLNNAVKSNIELNNLFIENEIMKKDK